MPFFISLYQAFRLPGYERQEQAVGWGRFPAAGASPPTLLAEINLGHILAGLLRLHPAGQTVKNTVAPDMRGRRYCDMTHPFHPRVNET